MRLDFLSSGQDIGSRPLLLIGVVMIIAAFQFLTTGVIAEVMARTYFESAHVLPYVLREDRGLD